MHLKTISESFSLIRNVLFSSVSLFRKNNAQMFSFLSFSVILICTEEEKLPFTSVFKSRLHAYSSLDYFLDHCFGVLI